VGGEQGRWGGETECITTFNRNDEAARTHSTADSRHVLDLVLAITCCNYSIACLAIVTSGYMYT
jgi:hypothetical protein